MDKRGKLLVIDGSDGVGKATQTKLLVARLRKERHSVRTLDFPQYKANFFGAFIKECLAGEHGDFLHLNPRIASVLYAADRFESKQKIETWLAQGTIVILDRYVSSNQMHQGGKIRDLRERKKFLSWLDTMEHKIFKLPRPNGIIYLDLPVVLSRKLIERRGAKDTVEQDIRYLQNAQKSALKIIQSNARWKKIICYDRNGILPREVIHERVYACAKELLGL